MSTAFSLSHCCSRQLLLGGSSVGVADGPSDLACTVGCSGGPRGMHPYFVLLQVLVMCVFPECPPFARLVRPVLGATGATWRCFCSIVSGRDGKQLLPGCSAHVGINAHRSSAAAGALPEHLVHERVQCRRLPEAPSKRERSKAWLFWTTLRKHHHWKAHRVSVAIFQGVQRVLLFTRVMQFS